MSEDNKTWLSGEGAPPSKPSPPLQITPGMVLKSTYRIEAELGSGGMGTVFRATHLGLDKVMAVKVLLPRAVSTPDSLARFEREAKVAGKVSHPAMTDVIDFGVEQGAPFIVMEYVAGVELADLIERQGPMPPRRAVAVMRQIVSLLRAAHALGIVHRDLKPTNIKILHDPADDSQLFVKVLDFGIAKVVGDVSGQLTSEGMLVGTPAYMAPEQISGKPIDGRTDLYSAGLIFHEMLSGKRAFRGETIARILHAQMSEPPPPLSEQVPEIVRQTAQKFYEKRSEDRFQDAAEADRALQACEDALRPPSANLAAASVLQGPRGEGTDDSGARTLAFHPRKTEPAPVTSGQPGGAQSKPSSSVAVAPSLVTEGQPAQEEPALVREPAPVAAPAPVAVAASVSAPVEAPLQAVQPRGSSGGGKVLALLGVAFVLLLAGLAGGVWAWKSGRLAGAVPLSPSSGEPKPTQLAEPAKDDAAPAEPERTEVAGANTAAEPTEEAPPDTAVGADMPGTEATDETPGGEAVAEADGESSGSGAQEEEGETSPPAEEVAPGCYSVVVALESSREADGRFGPWMPESVGTRTPIKCSAVPRAGVNKGDGVYDHWPDSPSEKLLYANPLTFQPKKKGAPNTRRMVVKAYTRVSADAP